MQPLEIHHKMCHPCVIRVTLKNRVHHLCLSALCYPCTLKNEKSRNCQSISGIILNKGESFYSSFSTIIRQQESKVAVLYQAVSQCRDPAPACAVHFVKKNPPLSLQMKNAN
jgi:hypothetical protein